jgi:hypothetical protein
VSRRAVQARRALIGQAQTRQTQAQLNPPGEVGDGPPPVSFGGFGPTQTEAADFKAAAPIGAYSRSRDRQGDGLTHLATELLRALIARDGRAALTRQDVHTCVCAARALLQETR